MNKRLSICKAALAELDVIKNKIGRKEVISMLVDINSNKILHVDTDFDKMMRLMQSTSQVYHDGELAVDVLPLEVLLINLFPVF